MVAFFFIGARGVDTPSGTLRCPRKYVFTLLSTRSMYLECWYRCSCLTACIDVLAIIVHT